ncbi:hypothetical protein YC2023_020409 [Brassica napus]
MRACVRPFVTAHAAGSMRADTQSPVWLDITGRCHILHDQAEVLSKSRSVQSSPVKPSLGFWPSPLRSTNCFSPRTL